MSSPSPSSSTTSSQRVRDYLFNELRQSGEERLPPIRDIARDLNVSTATVHHVYKDLRREGMIETTVGRGTFWISKAEAPVAARYCIGFNGQQVKFESSPLSLLTSDAIFRASTAKGRKIALQPFVSHGDGGLLELSSADVDGVILFGGDRRADEVIERCEQRGVPVVQANHGKARLTKNFVTTDHLGSALEIGRAWGATGRRRVVLLVHSSLHHSSTFLPRLSGLQLGMSETGCNPTDCVRLVIADSIFEQDGYAAISGELARGQAAPDAIYCIGDYLAVGAIKALQEAGLRVPEDVSVLGGTGLRFPGEEQLGLSQFCHPFDEVGEAIISMILERIEKKQQNIPGVYVPPKFRLRNTTRPEENALLKKEG